MKKFNWDYFLNKNNKIIVHCKTKEQAIDFCGQMTCHGLCWSNGDSYIEDMEWDAFEQDTHYSNHGTYGSKEDYNSTYKTFEWSDYMNDNENFNWEKFLNKKNKIAVHCETEKEAIDFCKQMDLHGLKWCTGDKYISKSNWDEYGKSTCYSNQGSFTDIQYYINNGYTLLEWSDYMYQTNSFALHIVCEDGIKTNVTLTENNKTYTTTIKKYSNDNFDSKTAILYAIDKVYNEKNKFNTIEIGDAVIFKSNNTHFKKGDILKVITKINDDFMCEGYSRSICEFIRMHININNIDQITK